MATGASRAAHHDDVVDGVRPSRSIAASTLAFSGTLRPPRRPSSAVITMREAQSSMRLASESGEKPPKTTEWMAPSRAQASMA